MNAIIRADRGGGIRTVGESVSPEGTLKFHKHIMTEENFIKHFCHLLYQSNFLPLPELFPLEGSLLMGGNEWGHNLLTRPKF